MVPVELEKRLSRPGSTGKPWRVSVPLLGLRWVAVKEFKLSYHNWYT